MQNQPSQVSKPRRTSDAGYVMFRPRLGRGGGFVCFGLVAMWGAVGVVRAGGPIPVTTYVYNGVTGVVPLHPGAVCGTEHPDVFFEQFQSGIDRGSIPNPATRALAPVTPRRSLPMGGGASTLSSRDVFPYEDSADLLSGNFTSDQLFFLMGEASAALIGQYGDNFDFIAFFLNFSASHQIGAAFYLGLENHTDGLGLGSFNRRGTYGVPGETVQGWVQMWNVNSWTPGSGSNAAFTRLVLGQEFEHRWALFLDPIVGDRTLQGDNGPCGRGAHWSFHVDGQGSGMEIAEWIGTNPAQKLSGTLHFNSDILGVFSATDLYLMGYLSPFEMDARNSELRYMDGPGGCSGSHSGPIFAFNSFQITQANGLRNPSSVDAQKDFRVGWIMLHRPGQPPTSIQVNRALGIMEQHQTDWFHGVLGRGTLSNSITEALGGDFDEDGDVDLDDYAFFDTCFSGADTASLQPGCNVFDSDVDGDVDLRDFGTFAMAFRGDCGVSITEPPMDTTVCEGAPAALTVGTDSPTFGYQWTYEGVPIAGATGATMTIPAVHEDAVGEYRVSVFGDCHTAHSSIAMLTIHPAPVFLEQPADAGTCEQGAIELSVVVEGFGPLTYQWQFMGNDIPGETGATLTIEGVVGSDLGEYRCEVTNGCGESTLSDPANVFFTPPADLTLEPESATVCEGDTISLLSSSSGLADFQWFKDNVPIAGATQPFLFIPLADASDSGAYHVVATGPCNFDVSADAIIEVIVCP